MPKRRRSSTGEHGALPESKRTRTRHPLDRLSELSDELLVRILHNLPIASLLDCQRLSHRFHTLAGDAQIWKNLYYNRFVLPRALRIPGIRTVPADDVLHFSSRSSKWLDKNTLVNRVDGKETNWKGQYKLRHNWSIGACAAQEIHLADQPAVPSLLVRLAEGVVLTASKEDGLRAWNLKVKELIAKCDLDDLVPTCMDVDEQECSRGELDIAIGLMDGGWGLWRLNIEEKAFSRTYKHAASSNGSLSAIACFYPYTLTSTNGQVLSLYNFTHKPLEESHEQTECPEDELYTAFPNSKMQESGTLTGKSEPHLLASLRSHTSWPPLSLAIRKTSSTIIASIAYSMPTYLSGYTIGLQELHLSPETGTITSSRLASAISQGFHSIVPPTSPTTPPSPNPPRSEPNQRTPSHESGSSPKPTSLSYSHPYILATHPDNTLSLYLCTSTASLLSISPGTKLWGHTSSVSAAEITARGKAVSVSTRGNELRIWELEGSILNTSLSSTRKRRSSEKSVQIRAEKRTGDVGGGYYDEEEVGARKQWVGFDDEMVIVLKESIRGAQALIVYDFT
ncbi:hypothetical protein B7494_g4911 [Chlorociboria aeruginascens]|nr:hypothetical protein B7494_g4911 [Chlorociboria aeruginascens]